MGGRRCFLPRLLCLCNGRAGGFTLLHLEGSRDERCCGHQRGSASPLTSRSSAFDIWIQIPCLLLEIMCNALCEARTCTGLSMESTDTPGRKSFHLCIERPKISDQVLSFICIRRLQVPLKGSLGGNKYSAPRENRFY